MNKSKKIVASIICRSEDAESVRNELSDAIHAYWRGGNFPLYFPNAEIVDTTDNEEEDFLEVSFVED